MTDEQIENMRKVLIMSLGPYAYAVTMPEEQAIAIIDNLQEKLTSDKVLDGVLRDLGE